MICARRAGRRLLGLVVRLIAGIAVIIIIVVGTRRTLMVAHAAAAHHATTKPLGEELTAAVMRADLLLDALNFGQLLRRQC